MRMMMMMMICMMIISALDSAYRSEIIVEKHQDTNSKSILA